MTTPPPRKPHPAYIPTLTNEQIKAIPIWASSIARNIRLTEKGQAIVAAIKSSAWFNPFGGKQ